MRFNFRLERFPVGRRFGRLVVLECVEPDGSGGDKLMIRVRCDCGTRMALESRRLLGNEESDRSKRWRGVRDCGCASVPDMNDDVLWRRGGGKSRPESKWGMARPGVSSGGHVFEDEDWPVRYLVVAGGQRTEHDTFEEAAEEFRIRARRAAA